MKKKCISDERGSKNQEGDGLEPLFTSSWRPWIVYWSFFSSLCRKVNAVSHEKIPSPRHIYDVQLVRVASLHGVCFFFVISQSASNTRAMNCINIQNRGTEALRFIFNYTPITGRKSTNTTLFAATAPSSAWFSGEVLCYCTVCFALHSPVH